MRGPSKKEVLETTPPDIRVSSASTQAYLDMRRKILSGEYEVDALLTPKEIQELYHISSNGTQLMPFRC